MKKYLIFTLAILLSTIAYSQRKSVILTPYNDIGHIELSGTTTVSGMYSVVYKSRESCELRQVNNEEFKFYAEICCWYNFDEYRKGRGRILNVSDHMAKVKVTCLEGEGLSEYTIIVDVKPRTLSNIMFPSGDDTFANCSKIKCELIDLY